MTNGQLYPTTTRKFIAEMRSMGYAFDVAHQSLEFIKGMSMLMDDTVTQTARNKTLAFLINNGAPRNGL